MRRWQLQEAKAKLSELVRDSQEAPQEISVHGEPVVVMLAKAEYERLQQHKLSFVDFMRQSPLCGVKLNIERDRTPTRAVRL